MNHLPVAVSQKGFVTVRMNRSSPADRGEAGLLLSCLLASGSEGRSAGGVLVWKNWGLAFCWLSAGVRRVPGPRLSSSGDLQALLRLRDWSPVPLVSQSFHPSK